jgi:HSP20 family protein
MTALTRWDPNREMQSMRSLMERFFGEPLGGYGFGWPRGDMSLALDVAEEKDAYVVKATVPGVKPEEIDVTMVNNVLTIRGEMKEDQEINEESYHLRERRWGSFSRSVTLPNTVDADKIEANYDQGVLTLRVPKVESMKPRKIAIHSAVEGSGK